MPLLGAHMSIAGGYCKAVELAARAGCEVVQVFTKNLPDQQLQTTTRFCREAVGSCSDLGGLSCVAAWDFHLLGETRDPSAG